MNQHIKFKHPDLYQDIFKDRAEDDKNRKSPSEELEDSEMKKESSKENMKEA